MPLHYTSEPDEHGKRHIACALCNFKRHTAIPVEQWNHVCKGHVEPCLHLGRELRREECPSCSGTVKVKVFACGKFGECTMAKSLSGIQTCESCPGYEPR